MSSATRAPAIPGIFDRSSKGLSLSSVEVDVERSRIRFLARVLGETNPIHHDVAAAHEAGHPDLVAPASFFTVLEALANDERQRRGEAPSASVIGSDRRYLLHGSERYRYGGLIYAGDVLVIDTRIVDFFDKQGGRLEFATLESSASHHRRGTLVTATRTLIHRLPDPEIAA